MRPIDGFSGRIELGNPKRSLLVQKELGFQLRINLGNPNQLGNVTDVPINLVKLRPRLGTSWHSCSWLLSLGVVAGLAAGG